MQESCIDLVACEPREDQQEHLSINYDEIFCDSNAKDETEPKCDSFNRKSTSIKRRKHSNTTFINDSKHFEKYEKLFIRLIKLDSTKLSQTGRCSNAKNDLQQLSSDKLNLKTNLNQCSLKGPKVERERGNLLHVNKTESVRIEELLWKQFKKSKEKSGPGGNSPGILKEPGISGFEIAPYEYKKTDKSV